MKKVIILLALLSFTGCAGRLAIHEEKQSTLKTEDYVNQEPGSLILNVLEAINDSDSLK